MTPGETIKNTPGKQSVSVGLAGTVTTLASPGIINGEASLQVDIRFQGPDAGLRVLGSGNVTVFGLPLGRAGCCSIWPTRSRRK